MEVCKFDERFDSTYTPKDKVFHPRCRWLVDLQDFMHIDIGSNKPKLKLERIRFTYRQKSKTRERVARLKKRYNYYLELKEEFSYGI